MLASNSSWNSMLSKISVADSCETLLTQMAVVRRVVDLAVQPVAADLAELRVELRAGASAVERPALRRGALATRVHT